MEFIRIKEIALTLENDRDTSSRDIIHLNRKNYTRDMYLNFTINVQKF